MSDYLEPQIQEWLKLLEQRSYTEIQNVLRRRATREVPYNIHIDKLGRDGHYYPEDQLPF